MADAARLIDPHIARALVEGRHADPFAVLGPHPFPPGSPAVPRQRGFAADDGQDPAANGGSLVLRVLVPGAERVEALEGDAAHGLLPVPGAHGLFAGTIGSRDYRLRAHRHGQSWDWDDPYRHGPVLGEIDEYLFGEGTHHRLWKVLGAAPIRHEGTDGTRFAVWAPNAERVSVVGDFNGWDGRRNVMRRRGSTGIWEIFLPGIGEGEVYKYEIRANGGRILPLKADPFGFGSEHPPRTGSVVRDITSAVWSDGGWLKRRGAAQSVDAPLSARRHEGRCTS